MKKIRNITIIGTSHISPQSVSEVQKFIEEQKPEIIAIELDRGRLEVLLSEKKEKPRFRDMRKVGMKGYMFALIGAWAEKKMGELTGVNPGDEMKLAVKLARKNGQQVALIDQPIEITLRRFSQKLSWKERFRFIGDIFNGVVLRKNIMAFDISKVPDNEIIKTMMNHVKQRYPNVYLVLVEERNQVMARNLVRLEIQNPHAKILAVIGAGHEEGIIEILNRIEPNITYTANVKV